MLICSALNSLSPLYLPSPLHVSRALFSPLLHPLFYMSPSSLASLLSIPFSVLNSVSYTHIPIMVLFHVLTLVTLLHLNPSSLAHLALSCTVPFLSYSPVSRFLSSHTCPNSVCSSAWPWMQTCTKRVLSVTHPLRLSYSLLHQDVRVFVCVSMYIV